MARIDVELTEDELENVSRHDVVVVTVTGRHGRKARLWLDVRLTDHDQVEGIMTVRKTNGTDVTKRAIAQYRDTTGTAIVQDKMH